MKKDWFKDASYIYETTPHDNDYDKNEHYITFFFPNAAGGPLEFKELLYKYNTDGSPDYKNLTAELLQCYIDVHKTI